MPVSCSCWEPPRQGRHAATRPARAAARRGGVRGFRFGALALLQGVGGDFGLGLVVHALLHRGDEPVELLA